MKPWQKRSLVAACGVFPVVVVLAGAGQAQRASVNVCDGLSGQSYYNCQFPSGNQYQGPLENGKRQGWGIFTYRDGTRCEGRFEQNELTGRGICSFANGDRYEGQFHRNLRQGPGVILYSNGNRCEGQFVADMLNGYGACRYASGNRYEGEFANGMRQGWGAFSYGATGTKCSGPFVKDQLNGNGLCLMLNGDRYEGGFANGQWQGSGTYVFANGERQSQQWAMGRVITPKPAVSTPIAQIKRPLKGKPISRRSRLARGSDPRNP